MRPVKNKVVVVGAGMVGSAVINALLSLELLAEIAVIDMNTKKAEGEALDASHTTSFAYSPNVHVKVGDYSDCADAQIIVITAGPSIKPGESDDRLSLAEKNVSVLKGVMEQITKYTQDAIIIIVTNPVDILTYYAQNHFNYDKSKIIGTGTLLDTARFRRILSEKYLVDTKNVHGYIMGEHGKSAFAAWSIVNIAGIPADKFDAILGSGEPLNREAIVKDARNVGIEIVEYKGYTSSGIAMTVNRLIKAIFLNELSVLPVSTTLEGEYGISNVALSIPCVIGSEGIRRRVEVPITEDEVKQLKNSAESLINVLQHLNIRVL
ncbi:L-lactate dehydrogenase [Clostridium thermarum]|uniref:L-lactate dehydrogenase n=1 Tax=Clostridium thermarum TaxID=1716543 RepID=UPI001120FB3C|nr:L-lactate dehydrogenase [Clostridium thermarum]